MFFLSCIGCQFALYCIDHLSHDIILALRVENGKTLPPSEAWWHWHVLDPRGEQYLHRLATMVKQLADKFRRDNPVCSSDIEWSEHISEHVDLSSEEDSESEDDNPVL
jgi:hypothetical protein